MRLHVAIAFATSPLDPNPQWTDVTGRVRQLRVGRGKARVLQTQQPGSIDVVLSNQDGALTPENTASPYWPNVKPLRRISVSVSFDTPMDLYSDFYSDIYGEYRLPLATGYIDAWPQRFAGKVDAEVSVRAFDALAVLNLMKVTASRPQELSSERVAAVLDGLDWTERLIDVGQTTLQATVLDGDDPAEHLNKVADTENGLLYVTAGGKVRFVSRHALMERAVGLTLTDSGAISYRDIKINYDTTDLWTTVEVSSQGIATQTVTDEAAKGEYFERVLSRTGLLHRDTDEQLRHAEYLLVGFRESSQRVDSVTVVSEGQTEADLVDLLSAELGDKVLVERAPEGDAISQRSYVEGIRVTWSPKMGFDVDLSLVPTTRRVDFWLVGDAIQSQAGVTTRGGY